MSTTTITVPISIALPDPATGGCLPCCEFTPSVSIACESRTGTADLCGWSGYDDGSYDAGDPEAWAGQCRKWRSKTLSGGSTRIVYSAFDCGGSCDGVERYEYSGTITLDCDSSPTPTGLREWYAGGASSCPDGDYQTTNTVYGIQLFYGCQDAFTLHSTLTIKTSTPCSGCLGIDSQTRYDAKETLSDEQTLYAALLADDPETEPGAECCAETTDADLTYPEDESPISITGTAVRLTATIVGEPSTAYVVTITFTNETTDTPPVPGANTSVEIEVTTDSSGDAAFTYDIPQPAPGFRRCYLSATIAPLVPPTP